MATKKNEIIRGMNLFSDGHGYAHMLEEVTLPVIKIKTEEVRLGGMDSPMDMDVGMEKLTLSYTLAGFDPDTQKQIGLLEGQSVRQTLKGATEDRDGTVHSEEIGLIGKVTEIDSGSWKPGEKVQMKVTISLTYYSRDRDGERLHEIDVENMKRIINGKDQLESVRKAIGF